jgi:hypothetical protein
MKFIAKSDIQTMEININGDMKNIKDNRPIPNDIDPYFASMKPEII